MKQTYLFRVDFWLNNPLTISRMVAGVFPEGLRGYISSNCAAITGAEDREKAIDKALALCGMPVNQRMKREILAVDAQIIGILLDGKLAS